MDCMKSATINITISELKKNYHQVEALKSLNLVFTSGKLNLITGDNGSGKTTMLKCIMNHVRYKGKIIKRNYRIGYAPENYVMPGFMSIHEFLLAIGRIKHLYKGYLDEELDLYLDMFELKDKLNTPIKSLSNGMKQKVNIIQALLNHPKIIIFDEPLIGLDFNSQKRFIKSIIDLSKDKLVIISTHHPEKFNTKKKSIYRFNQGEIE
ncbi:ABC transporter ATP-binding protein [Mycoplasmatota bacterium]|nr:ABC transporter ATP-binding protein [Mycoplasmatota bacterium]